MISIVSFVGMFVNNDLTSKLTIVDAEFGRFVDEIECVNQHHLIFLDEGF